MFSLLLLIVFPLIVNARELVVTHKPELAYRACAALLSESSDELFNFCSTYNQPALGSMAYCLVENYNDSTNDYINPFLKTCKSLNMVQFMNAYDNATNYIREQKQDDLFGEQGGPNFPVAIEYDKVNKMWNKLYTHSLVDNYSIWYGTILMSYWGLVMLIASINYWSYFIFPGFVKSIHGPISNWIRRKVVLPPLFSKTHAVHKSWKGFFEVIIPLRLETFILLIHFLLCVIFCSTNIYMSRFGIISTSIGSRAGIILCFNIPLLILFAGRNNLAQWITGWPQSRFLIFHRWIARIAFLIFIVHGVSKTFGIVHMSPYGKYMSQPYMEWAAVAVTCLGLLLLHSLQFFRNSRYEVFLLIHNFLALLFVIGGWKHTSVTSGKQFFIAATSVWVFDKLMRILRMYFFGVRKATVELKGDNTLKITVPCSSLFGPFPGSHAYVYFFQWPYFWESHPFSVVDSKNGNIEFAVKVKNGITNLLYQELLNNPKNDSYDVIVEGFYSQVLPIRKFGNTIFISGGNGISGVYFDVINLMRHEIESNRYIKFYWIIHSYKSIEWFLDELEQFKQFIHPVIYVTHPYEELDPEMNALSSGCKSELNSKKSNHLSQVVEINEGNEKSSMTSFKSRLSFVEFRHGRPNVSEIMAQEINQCQDHLAFVTCGPNAMIDEMRASFVKLLGRNKPKRLELFEINQGW